MAAFSPLQKGVVIALFVLTLGATVTVGVYFGVAGASSPSAAAGAAPASARSTTNTQSLALNAHNAYRAALKKPTTGGAKWWDTATSNWSTTYSCGTSSTTTTKVCPWMPKTRTTAPTSTAQPQGLTAPLPALVWNANLASTALAYATKCVYAHNANRLKDYQARAGTTTSITSVGENIAANAGTVTPTEDASMTSATKNWWKEIANYKYNPSESPTTSSVRKTLPLAFECVAHKII